MIDSNEKLSDKSVSPKTSEITEYTQRDLQVIFLRFANSFTDPYIPYSQQILKTWVIEMWIPVFSIPFDRGYLKSAEVRNNLAAWLGADKSFQIFGLWVDYETVPELIALAETIKLGKPDWTFIIAWWQWTANEETRKYILDSWYIDAINIGHAQPFFGFLNNVKNSDIISRDILFKNSKWLLATSSEPIVPEWEFPHLSPFPLLPLEVLKDPKTKGKKFQLRIPHYQNCPNQCDYCAQQKTKNSKQIFDNIIKTIEKTEFEKPIDYVKFEWPTFEGSIVKTSKAILNTIQDKQWFMPSSHIVMDSKQFQKKNYNNTVSLLDEVNAMAVHLWINSVDWNTAFEVGRKNSGRVRTEEELQDEILWVLHFVKNSRILDFKIDILLSPFDAQSTIEKIIEVAKELLQIQKETNKKITLFLSPLIPYPWTELFTRHREKIDFTDYKQLWSSSLYDPTLRKEDDSLFGTQFLRKFSAPFFTSGSNYLTKKDKFREEYLQFLALSMTYQYLQWKTKLDEMDILYPEYKKDKWVIAIFNSIKTQSIELILHTRRRKHFKNHSV